MSYPSDPTLYHGSGGGGVSHPSSSQYAAPHPGAPQQAMYPFHEIPFDRYNIVDDLLFHAMEIDTCNGDYVSAREHFERMDLVIKDRLSHKDKKTVGKWFDELHKREKDLKGLQNMDQWRSVRFLSAVLCFVDRNDDGQLKFMRKVISDDNIPLVMKCIIHYMMARVLYKKPKEALQVVQEGLNLVNGDFSILLGLQGQLLWQVHGDKQGAFASWARALQLDPTYDTLRITNAGIASNMMQEYLFAAKEFEQIALRYPSNVEWGIKAADLHVRNAQQIGNTTGNEAEMQSNYDTALRILYYAGQQFPGRANVHEKLARSHWAMALLRSMPAPQAADHYERAIDNFEQAHKFDPSNPSTKEGHQITLQEYHDYCRSHGLPPTRFSGQDIPMQTFGGKSPQDYENQLIAAGSPNGIPSPSPSPNPSNPIQNAQVPKHTYGDKHPEGILIFEHFESFGDHIALAIVFFLLTLIPFPPISLLFAVLMGSIVLRMPAGYVLMDAAFAFFPVFNIIVAVSHLQYFFAARKIQREESDRLLDLRRASAEPKYVPLLFILCVLSTPGVIFGIVANALIILFVVRKSNLTESHAVILIFLSFIPFVSLVVAVYYALHFGKKQKMSKYEGHFFTWDEYWGRRKELDLSTDLGCQDCCTYEPNYYGRGYSHWSSNSTDDCFWCCFWCFMWSNYTRPYPHQPPLLCNCVFDDPVGCNPCHMEPISCRLGDTCTIFECGNHLNLDSCNADDCKVDDCKIDDCSGCKIDDCSGCKIDDCNIGDCNIGDCNIGDCKIDNCDIGGCDCGNLDLGGCDCGNLDCNIN